MGDTLEGSEHVLKLAMAKIPSAVGLVSFVDDDRKELVIVRQSGGKSALLARQPVTAPLAKAALFSSGNALVIDDAATDGRVLDERWKKIGHTPTSVLCVPVKTAERHLGLIELADPAEGGPYTPQEADALTYLGQQLSEFLAENGVVLDDERIRRGVAGTPGDPPGSG